MTTTTPFLTRTASVWIGLLAFVLYLPTVAFGFVNYDDPWLIQSNTLLQQLDLSALQTVWFDMSLPARLRLGSEYLPIRDLSVMLDYTMFGSWIGGFHLTNALLYALGCGLLVTLLKQWLQAPRLAWLTGVLFACHPLHVESVSWLSERKGLLAMCFVFAAAIAFRAFARTTQKRYWLLAALSLTAGVWSKAIALMGLPFLGTLLWLYPPVQDEPNEPKATVHTIHAWLGFGLLALATALAFFPVWKTGQTMSMVQTYHGGSWSTNAWLAMRVHAMYIRLCWLSGGYGIVYPLQAGQHGFGPMLSGIIGMLSVGLVIVVALLGLLKKGRWRLAGLAACSWGLFLLPVSQLFLPLQNVIADRYMLLPSMGWALAVAGILHYVVKEQRLQHLALTAFLACSILLTLFQTQSWSSSRALYSQALEVHPTYIHGMLQLSRLEAQAGRPKHARIWLTRAIKTAPHHPKVLLHQSLYWLRLGKTARAIAVLRRATTSSPDDKIRANLALLLLRQKKAKEALRWAREAATYRPHRVHNQRTLGLAALRNKQYTLAQRAFQKALQLEPGNPRNAMNLAALYAQTKQQAKAARYLQRARSLQRK